MTKAVLIFLTGVALLGAVSNFDFKVNLGDWVFIKNEAPFKLDLNKLFLKVYSIFSSHFFPRSYIYMLVKLYALLVVSIIAIGSSFILYDLYKNYRNPNPFKGNYFYTEVGASDWSVYMWISDLLVYIRKDFSALEACCFMFLMLLYPLYLLLFIPFLFYYAVRLLLDIAVCFISSESREVLKPDWSSLPIEPSVHDLFIFLPKCAHSRVYVILYSVINFLKNRKISNIFDLFRHFALTQLSGRPDWFIRTCLELTNDICRALRAEVWHRKKVKVWSKVFCRFAKKIAAKYYLEKSLNYYKIISNLKIKISPFYMNGLTKIIELAQCDKVIVFKNIRTLVDSLGTPHTVLTNDTNDAGIVLTSSKNVWDTASEKFIEADLLHNLGKKPQMCIFSLLDPNNVKEFILTNPWKNLNITSVDEFYGFVLKSNLIFWTDAISNILVQQNIGESTVREIIDVENGENLKIIMKYTKDDGVQNKFIISHKKPASYKEFIAQYEFIGEAEKIKSDMTHLGFSDVLKYSIENLHINIKDSTIAEKISREFAWAVLKDKDY